MEGPKTKAILAVSLVSLTKKRRDYFNSQFECVTYHGGASGV